MKVNLLLLTMPEMKTKIILIAKRKKIEAMID